MTIAGQRERERDVGRAGGIVFGAAAAAAVYVRLLAFDCISN